MTCERLMDLISLHEGKEVVICTKDGCFEIIAVQPDGSYSGKLILAAGAYVPADWEGPKT